MSEVTDKKKLCIVGGGPAGLSALRRVLDTQMLTGTMFEQKDDVGGVWNYSGSKVFPTSPRNLSEGQVFDKDPECVNTMYDDLRCNVPHPLLSLDDFKHTKLQGTFPTQKDMQTYLRDYATHFKLWPHVQLNTAVVSIRPENSSAPQGKPCRWIVETHNHKDDIFSTAIFDAIIICTGKNTYPYEPKIPGLETFQGKVMHCKYFKNADEFQGKNVVCIGLGGASADMGLHLSGLAKSVTISHKFPSGFKLGLLPPGVREVKNVKNVTPDGVVTVDDEKIECDVIILCTGYTLKFPFIHPECGLVVKEEKYVPNLYRMTIFTKRPTLAIINMVYRAPEVKLNEIQYMLKYPFHGMYPGQIKYFVRYLEGKFQLPSYETMEEELKVEEAQKEEQGVPYSEWFQVGTLGMEYWKYFSQIIEECGIQDEYKYFPMLEHLWKTTLGRIFGKFAIFRKDELRIINEGTWELLFAADPENPDSKPSKMTMTLNSDSTLTIETTDL